MRRVSSKAILGTVALGALLGGCATTVEMGPGYYHYDTGLASPPARTVVTERAVVSAPAVVTAPAVVSAPAIVTTPTVVYEQPAVTTYRAPPVVYYRDAPVYYRDAPIVYRAPSVVYSPDKAAPYFDHAQ